MKDTIICAEIEPSVLNEQPIKIIVSFTDKRVKSSHVEYILTTMPFGHQVTRKYPDFVWLRDILSYQFTAYYIPNLPNKKFKIKSSTRQIEREKKYIEVFLEYLASSDLIKRSPILVEFLKEEVYETFKEYRRDSGKSRKLNSLNGIVSGDGLINCDYSSNEEYFQTYLDYLTRQEEILKKLSKEGVNIANLANSLSTSISNYADLVKDLESTSDLIASNKKLSKNLYSKFSESMHK